MPSSGRLIGLILVVAGLALGVIFGIWLLSGTSEGTLQGSGPFSGSFSAFSFLWRRSSVVVFSSSPGGAPRRSQANAFGTSAGSSTCS